ncbi:MAG: nitroreductase family deazaflavin-dependent oxidoreductase [Gammaproteobacteria bacterium]
MTAGSEIGWADLQRATAELIGEHGPGSAGWNGEESITRGVNERFMQALREHGGKVPGELQAIPCLILTTIGARTGQPRPVPLAYHEVDGRLLIIASMGGARSNPPWYHNLVANPRVIVEKDGRTFEATAVVTDGADRDALFAQVCAALPAFAEYQARTARTIPVIELKPL